MARATPAVLLRELEHLALQPTAQAHFAAQLLFNERRAQVIAPALAVLEDFSIAEARPALLQLYADLDVDGVRNDAGGLFRATALRAIRRWATLADLPVFERAVATYEFLPPGRSEEASPIRAAGLVVMSDLDPELASFQAARILVDHNHTSPLSGEPAKTAAQVLASQSQYLALYLYTLRDQTHDDVLAECIRHLSGAPDSIVRDICERFRTHVSEVARIGLIDMLLSRSDRPLFSGELERLLALPMPLTVFRYLVIAMAASRQHTLEKLIVAAANAEQEAGRAEALGEAVALIPAEHHGDGMSKRNRVRRTNRE